MRLVFCPGCKKSYNIRSEYLGSVLTCDSCGRTFTGVAASNDPPRAKQGKSFEVLDLIGQKIGNYRLRSVLGRGSMGVVYLAQDEALLRPTALKILSWQIEEGHGQDPVKWFLAEARSVASINHPGIVQVYGTGRYNDHYYIAMEFVSGDAVDKMLHEKGPFPPDRGTEVLMEAAEALYAAHSSGVIHRDIKPANLLLTAEGKVKLSDFSMALTGPGVTAAVGQRIGTPYFTAPELWRGQPASIATDIYSLGATYFQILTGELLFASKNVQELERRHLQEEVPDPSTLNPKVPRGCHEILKRCLAKAPQDRFVSAQELAWMASVVLKEMEVPQEVAVASPGLLRAAGFSPESDTIETSFTPATGPFATYFRFEHQPFCTPDTSSVPYTGEPFVSLGQEVAAGLTEPGSVVMLSGPPGSGRTILCRSQLLALSTARPVIYVNVAYSTGSRRRALRRVCMAAGAVSASSSDAEIQSLLRRMADARKAYGTTTIVAVDGLTSFQEEASDLELLMRGAATTKSYGLLVVGLKGIVNRLSALSLPEPSAVGKIDMRPLDYRQTLEYLRVWIAATLSRDASPIIITPDAGLLVGYWSGGILGEMNRIATNMLFLAAAGRRRIVTSWDAWAGAKHLNLLVTDDDINPALKAQPPEWPDAEAFKIIGECRLKVGMSPWIIQECPPGEIQPGTTGEP